RIRIAKEIEGVIVKADTLGSLEAMAEILKANNVQVRIADVGDISKRDVIDAYLQWAKNKRETKSEAEFEALVKPGKVTVLPNCIFRRAKPAIFGVEVLGGRLKAKYGLMRKEDGSDLGEVDQIQDQGKAVPEAKVGMQVAISM